MLHSNADVYHRGFSLLGMKILLCSNNRVLIADDEYFLSKGGHLHSLLSNFQKPSKRYHPPTGPMLSCP